MHDMLSRESAELFPRYGEKIIAVTDVLDWFISSQSNGVIPLCSCNIGCKRVVLSRQTTFMGVCSPYVWSTVRNVRDEAETGTMQQWLNACLHGYGFLSSSRTIEAMNTEVNEHAMTCSGYMSRSEVFVKSPALIYFQIYPEYATTTRISLELCVPLVHENVFYRLACIIYYTGSHFTARLTAGADTFSDRKNETSKCCDISFDLLKVKTSSEKQVERRDHLRTLLR